MFKLSVCIWVSNSVSKWLASNTSFFSKYSLFSFCAGVSCDCSKAVLIACASVKDFFSAAAISSLIFLSSAAISFFFTASASEIILAAAFLSSLIAFNLSFSSLSAFISVFLIARLSSALFCCNANNCDSASANFCKSSLDVSDNLFKAFIEST